MFCPNTCFLYSFFFDTTAKFEEKYKFVYGYGYMPVIQNVVIDKPAELVREEMKNCESYEIIQRDSTKDNEMGMHRVRSWTVE